MQDYFLNKDVFKKSAILYEFCRYIDDIADKHVKKKKMKLNNVVKNLNDNSKNLKLKQINYLLSKKIIDKHYIIQLIHGVSLDLKNEVTINNEKELVTYAYFVAGTVGIMMAKILKVKELVAFKYAVDLGIAFQLTNIARDILEDANINRIYIPKKLDNVKQRSDKIS